VFAYTAPAYACNATQLMTCLCMTITSTIHRVCIPHACLVSYMLCACLYLNTTARPLAVILYNAQKEQDALLLCGYGSGSEGQGGEQQQQQQQHRYTLCTLSHTTWSCLVHNYRLLQQLLLQSGERSVALQLWQCLLCFSIMLQGDSTTSSA
jgi:hypothetical protein